MRHLLMPVCLLVLVLTAQSWCAGTNTSTSVPWYKGQPGTAVGQECRNPVDGAIMVWVPGGTFRMGSISGVGWENEHPAHSVTLTGYWIYKYEVTVAQYLKYSKATGRDLPKWMVNDFDHLTEFDNKGWRNAILSNHPIGNVEWSAAHAYCAWAKAQLPTEAQWEYAARGPHSNNYAWGGTATAANRWQGWDAKKCVNENNVRPIGKNICVQTRPVGSFPAGASWCKAMDMTGNAWEWCADWYADYTEQPLTNPAGPKTGELRITKGGGTDNGKNDSRCAYRNTNPPDSDVTLDDFGFRCVVIPSSNKSVERKGE